MVAMEMEKRYLSYHSKSCKGEKYESYTVAQELIKLKVTSATKHKNTAKEIIIYTHRVNLYSIYYCSNNISRGFVKTHFYEWLIALLNYSTSNIYCYMFIYYYLHL